MAKLHSDALAGGGVELKSALVDGAAADTDIAVSGWSWKKDPRLVACVKLEGTATYTAPVSIAVSELQRGAATPDGSIQLSTTATTGDKLLLIWAQRA